MNWILWIVVGGGIITVALLLTGSWRYVLTGYLIARVTPYEQSGTGAGSILLIGDSTGYGTGASRTSESVAGRLGADYPDYKISNNSVNGRKIEGALDAVADFNESDQYDLVLLQIGANDLIAQREPDAVVSDMQQLIEQVMAHTDQIVIVSAGNIGATSAFSGEQATELEQNSRQYDQQMKAVAESHQGVHFVSLFDEPADDPFVTQPKVYTSIDGLHPTSAGYAVWYQKMRPHLTPILSPK